MTTARQIFAPVPEIGDSVASANATTTTSQTDLIPALSNVNGIEITGLFMSLLLASTGNETGTLNFIKDSVTQSTLQARCASGSPGSAAFGGLTRPIIIPAGEAVSYSAASSASTFSARISVIYRLL